ncbi:hypothetical protein AVEN_50329-1, partial [Araneus ventricosus]
MTDSESESKGSDFNISLILDLSSNGIYSEFNESEDDYMISVRMRVEEKTVCPALPRFEFTENLGLAVNISKDNLIQYFEYFFELPGKLETSTRDIACMIT